MTAPATLVGARWTLPGRPARCPDCGGGWVRRVWDGGPTEHAACPECGWAETRRVVTRITYQGIPLDGTADELRHAVALLRKLTVGNGNGGGR